MKSRTIDVLFSDLCLKLYLDAEEYDKALTKLGWQTTIDTSDGCEALIGNSAYIFLKYTKPTTQDEFVYLISVLNHEASHLVDDIFESVSEVSPCGETRAYLTERITSTLTGLFLEMTDTKNIPPAKKKTPTQK